MSSLLASLSNSGNALGVLQQALSVIQNNVSNASTPGYATQQLNLEALPMDVASGGAGGVAARGLISSRNDLMDSAVQHQLQALGLYTAQAQSTATVQSFFDVSGATGVPTALSSLFARFSAWSASPTDAVTEQSVISAAANVANSINGLSSSLGGTARNLSQQISSTVSQINSISAQIQQYNVTRTQETQPDPGADAQLHSALENLANLTNFTALTQADGTVTVLIGGSTPLVSGDTKYALSSADFVNTQPSPTNPGAPPTAHVLNSQGADITTEITGGQLAGLLDSRNNVLGSILGTAQEQGTLNQFATGLATAVNQILQSGTVSTSPGAASGAPLFTLDTADPTLAAGTIRLNPGITVDQLAPVDSNGNSNGNATALAALANGTTPQGQIAGFSFAGFFGQIAAAAGQANQSAQNNQQSQQQVVSQVTSLRDQVSGVSLDGQAAAVLEFQRAYQAVSRVLTTMNSLLDSALALLPQAP